MKIKQMITALAACLTGTFVWAAPVMAPAVPDLTLPAEEENSQPAVTTSRQTTGRSAAPAVTREATSNEEVVVTNATIDRGGEYVEKITPDLSKLPPLPKMPTEADFVENDAETNPDLVAAKATELEANTGKTGRVVYNPRTDRDPTLSADDTLLLKEELEKRRRLKEAERKRKLEEERRRVEEAERQRQLELERLRDPSREIRGKIKVNGIIGREVFIGSKVYKVNDTVLGARIVSVQPDSVVFLYKGQKFTKKVHLQ